MLQRPNNPVGRVIYDSIHLIVLPVALVVLKVLSKFLPLPAFLVVLAVPTVWFYFQFTAPDAPPPGKENKIDDVTMKSRKADRLMKELEREEREQAAREQRKEAKDAAKKKKKNGSKQQQQQQQPSKKSEQSFSSSSSSSQNVDEDVDDDYILQRMAEARKASKNLKAR